MSTFRRCVELGRQGDAEWYPYVQRVSDGSVRIENGLIVDVIQKLGGDILLNREGRLEGWDSKTEGKYTGRLFLEMYSNRPHFDGEKFFERPGWGITSKSKWLGAFYKDRRVGVIANLFRLREWAWGPVTDPRLKDRRKLPAAFLWHYTDQGRNAQKNVTSGFCVPIAALADKKIAIGFQFDQLDLFEKEQLQALEA